MTVFKYKQWFIIPSSLKYKKHDVYHKDNLKKKVLSFGDKRYEQYQDKLGYYKELDHLDKKRRDAYYKRHNKEYGVYSADWFAKSFLW